MRLPLDLREHAALSLRFFNASIDQKRQGLPYFWIDFLPNPPQFAHEMAFDDIENLGRWLYGIACAQRVSGSKEAEETREIMLREIDRRIAGPYGFPYTTDYTVERYGPVKYSWLWGNRSVLEGWIQCWRSAESDEQRVMLAARIETMVSGLDAFSIRKGQCVFFPTYEPSIDWVKPADMKIPDDADESAWQQFYTDSDPARSGYLPLPADSLGGMIWPLVEWYELTGSDKALELAIGIAHTIVQYHPMRSNHICPIGCFSNNHGVLNAMAGVLACHRHVPNNRHLIWVETLFEYYLNRCSSSFGWVTEYERIDPSRGIERLSSEGCAVIDMVRVAIELGRCGFLDGWDVAERFTRNYMTQSQIKSVTPFDAPNDMVINHEGRGAVIAVPDAHRDSQGFWNRVIGAMAGWGAPNDVLDPRGRLAMCIQNCCSSHLPIGLMHVWEHAVEMHGDTLAVNMLLSQDGPLARTIDSQPQNGVLDIIPKVTAKLSVRMPDWVDESRVRISVNEQPATITWPLRSRYAQIPEVAAGSKVRVEYPLRTRTVVERLGGTAYTTYWRGDTVTNISPGGEFIPVFPGGAPSDAR
jgi:hypothetical protein